MNRHCHRLVFNRARSQVMAVAESAAQCTSAPGQSTRSRSRIVKPDVRMPALRLALWVAWGLLALPAGAQISADRSALGSQRPNVLSAPNGVPLVNIQTPSAAGVSRNAYERFDIDPRGAIFNNSRINAPTQLGGWVQGNPWLARGTARVILNEVRSSDPSLLRGFLEVAGTRAQVVIANPSGITCDGCGFINTPRATLTTGAPLLSAAGDLDGLRVGRGTVSITGEGLDGRGASYTDIIARAVRLDAQIRADTLSVIAGAQDVTWDGTGAVTSIVANHASPVFGTAPAKVAIDVASLGGMYAGRITLVGNGAGVGVRNAGHIGASAGDLVVTAEGRIENPGTLMAQGDAWIDAQAGISNAGTVFARGHANASTRGDIDHGGVFAAGGNLKISASGTDSTLRAAATSVLAAGVQDDGSAGAAGILAAEATIALIAQGRHLAGTAVDLRAGWMDLRGSQTAAGTVTLRAGEAGLDLTGAEVVAVQDLDATAATALRTDAASLRGQDLRLQAQSLSYRGGVLLATRALRVQAGSLVGGGQLLSQGDVTLDLAQDFLHTGILRAGRDVTLRAQAAVANEGEISAGAALRLDAGGLDNRASGSLLGGQVQIALAGPQGLTNRGLVDGGQVDVDTPLLRNLGTGRLYGDRISLAAQTLVNASEGASASVIAARERLDLGVGTLDNREHALIFSAGDLAIGGAIDAGRRAVSRAHVVRNSSATVEALGNVHLDAGKVINEDLHFRTELVDLPGQHVTELAGQGSSRRYTPGDPDVYVYNDQSDYLHTPEGNHEIWHRYEFTRQVSETRVARADPGRLLSGVGLQITADNVLNDKGHILAGGELVIRGALTNTEPSGTRITREQGEVVTTKRANEKGRDRSQIDYAAYQPPDRIESITLGPSIARSHTAAFSGAAPPRAPDRVGPTMPSKGAPTDPGIRAGQIDTRVPAVSLFRIAADPASRMLVETDPRFTQYQLWLGSDYLLNALAQDPVQIQKRLGDGFYEQRLVREQVAQLTGRRLLAGYASDEEQFRALMGNGATFARAHNLRPGIALSAEQMAQLTSDIVWLVEQDVVLPDGRASRALVPQVYARVREGDLSASGALISGRTVDLQLTEDLANSGAIQGAEALRVQARNLKNLGGRLSGETVDLQAVGNIENSGGEVRAGQRLVLSAGRDLLIASTTASTASAQGERTAVDRVATLYVTSPAGSLQASAGRDIRITAADARSAGTLTMQAGRDLSLDTLDLLSSEAIERDSANYRRESQRSQAGSTLQAQGDIRLHAGNDLHARAAHVTSVDGALAASAGRDVLIAAGESRVQIDDAHRTTSRGTFSKKTVTTRKGEDETTAQATVFSGRTTEVLAGRDMTLTGSQVVSESGTVLEAGQDLAVQAATETRTLTDERSVTRSGLFGSGGFGFTLGTQSQSVQQQEAVTSAAGSTVGSVRGDVQIGAAGRYRQVGSEVLAPGGDIDIRSGRVEVVEAREERRFDSASQTRQSGLSVSLSNPVATAAQTVRRVRQAEREADDARVSALAALTQGLAVYEAGSAVADAPALAGGFSLNLSLGSSRSSSRTSQVSESAAGSRVLAGNELRIRAEGPDADLVVRGSGLEAGGAVDLGAGGEVHLLAARNASRQHSEERSSSASVGLSLALGGPTPGVSVMANASRGSGQGEGESQTWTNTRIAGGSAVRIDSVGDTALRGAVVQGPEVIARVGGNLVVESLQDTARQSSQQRTDGAGVSYGSTGLRGEVHAGRSKADMRFASVSEQSGVVAGDRGFDIVVGGVTELKGGQLSGGEGAAAPVHNRLTTAAIITGDLENTASATASSSGVALSSDVITRGKYGASKAVVASTMLNAGETVQSRGQTRAAVSPGEVTVTDEARQRGLTGESAVQAVTGLTRDMGTAHSPVFRPDMDAMQRAVNAQRVVKRETFKAVTVFTDEAYRSRFEVKPPLSKVACPIGSNCVSDPKQVTGRPATLDEFANAPDGAVLFVNGIFNDESRGQQLAYQTAEPGRPVPLDELGKPRDIYLTHLPPARYSLSEFIGVAYEKLLAEVEFGAGKPLGYTAGVQEAARLLRARGQKITYFDAHSRGTLVQAAAFAVLTNTPDANGNPYRNPNLFIRGAGGATGVANYTAKAIPLLGDPEKAKQITFTYFDNDPVSTSFLAGGNAGRWTMSDLFKVWRTSNSMHSCYGSGAPGCTQVEVPMPSGPQGTPDGNAKVVRFSGGTRAARVESTQRSDK